MPNSYKCLDCVLPDCIEHHKDCLLFGRQLSPQKRYYLKKKNDPEFRKKRHEAKKKWRKTPSGKASMNRSVKKYNKANPDIVRKCRRDYHERNKEVRLRKAREYKARKRKERKVVDAER